MGGRPWSKDEIEKVKATFPVGSKAAIMGEVPNRSWVSIWQVAHKIGLVRNAAALSAELSVAGKKSPPMGFAWSEKEDALLRELYENTPRDELLVHFPGRSDRALRCRAEVLGVRKDKGLVQRERMSTLKKNMMGKYGVEYSFQLKSVRDKSVQTNLAKRGVRYPTQSASVREKVRETVQKKYGCDNVFQSGVVKKKSEATCMKRFGVSKTGQSPEVHLKAENTNRGRYGVSNAFQLVDRVRSGMLRKYGVESPQQSELIRERTKKTNIAKYGFPFSSSSPKVRAKREETNLKRYGAKSPLGSREVRKKLATYGESDEEINFISILKLVDPEVKYHVMHPDTGDVIDYYLPSFDLWVQYDGVYWHGKILPAKETRHYPRVVKAQERDQAQNERIPNLIRFWSDDVECAKKNGTIVEMVKEAIARVCK